MIVQIEAGDSVTAISKAFSISHKAVCNAKAIYRDMSGFSKRLYTPSKTGRTMVLVNSVQTKIKA